MLLLETLAQLLFGGLISCYLIKKSITQVRGGTCTTLNTHTRLQLAMCTRAPQRKGNLTLHHLMELIHKLCAVLLGDTRKLHCTEEDLPGAVVAVSLPQLD